VWFQSILNVVLSPPTRPVARRTRRAAAIRQLAARRLFVEGLEDRRLMAFNVLAEYFAGQGPSDFALAQVDAGSQLDLVIANNDASAGSVRLGNSNGTFNGAQSTGVASTSLATGDLTGDGITDLVSIGADLTVQAGNGDGTFQLPQIISLPPQVAPGNPDPTALPQSLRSVTLGDLNADGKLDLIVAGQTSFSVYERYYTCGYYGCGYIGWWTTHSDGYVNVLIGNGSGGFAAPIVTPLGRGNIPSAAAIGDLNGDGNADVLTANSNNVSSLLGNGTGTLAVPLQSGSGSLLQSVSLGDVDGDGRLDALTGWGSTLTVQKGQGNGTFTPLSSTSMNHPVDSAVMGDVNGDGRLDLVAVGSNFTCTSHGYYGCYDGDYSGQISVVLDNGAGGFSLPIASSLGTDFNGRFADVALANLTGDGLPELVTIENLTGIAIVASNDGDWVEPVALSISSPTVTEGNSGMTNAVFNVTLASPSSRDVTVDYSTADLDPSEEYWYGGTTATAGVDYTAALGTLTIPAGQTSATISVPVIGDRVGEWTELFFLDLSNPTHAILSNNRAVGTIIDDEPYVSFEYYSGSEVVEGDSGTKLMTFMVELSAASDIAVTVDFATADGTAVASSDYQTAAGTLTIPAGETTGTITVPVHGDTQAESDEYFTVGLSNATNAKIGNSVKYGNIVDDDTNPAISISDAWLNEGNNGTKRMTFTVTLSQPSSVKMRVNYATASGTAKTSDNDYVAKSGTITFNPGQTTKTVTISIKGDKKNEADESFFVNLSGGSGAPMDDSQGEGLILNDDGSSSSSGGKNPRPADVDALMHDWLFSTRKKRRG
jgi:hypothetical protein